VSATCAHLVWTDPEDGYEHRCQHFPVLGSWFCWQHGGRPIPLMPSRSHIPLWRSHRIAQRQRELDTISAGWVGASSVIGIRRLLAAVIPESDIPES